MAIHLRKSVLVCGGLFVQICLFYPSKADAAVNVSANEGGFLARQEPEPVVDGGDEQSIQEALEEAKAVLAAAEAAAAEAAADTEVAGFSSEDETEEVGESANTLQAPATDTTGSATATAAAPSAAADEATAAAAAADEVAAAAEEEEAEESPSEGGGESSSDSDDGGSLLGNLFAEEEAEDDDEASVVVRRLTSLESLDDEEPEDAKRAAAGEKEAESDPLAAIQQFLAEELQEPLIPEGAEEGMQKTAAEIMQQLMNVGLGLQQAATGGLNIAELGEKKAEEIYNVVKGVMQELQARMGGAEEALEAAAAAVNSPAAAAAASALAEAFPSMLQDLVALLGDSSSKKQQEALLSLAKDTLSVLEGEAAARAAAGDAAAAAAAAAEMQRQREKVKLTAISAAELRVSLREFIERLSDLVSHTVQAAAEKQGKAAAAAAAAATDVIGDATLIAQEEAEKLKTSAGRTAELLKQYFLQNIEGAADTLEKTNPELLELLLRFYSLLATGAQ